MSARPAAVIPPAVMTPHGRYGDGWRRWCTDNNVSLLAFVREGLRRRRLLGVDIEGRHP